MSALFLPRRSGLCAEDGPAVVRNACVRVALLCCLASVAVGCSTTAAEPGEPPPPVVTVSRPIVRDVTDQVDFTGRTEAESSVDIRARVTGYLVKMPFVEGSDVKTGELLFEIDPRPYQAQVDKAKADVELNTAKLKLAKADKARAKRLIAQGVGAITEQEFETYQAKEDQSAAELDAAKASLESAEINLQFTKITSPINGRVSRYYLTLGNLVNADSTLLTTVVSEDPIDAYFDADEMTYLAVTRKLLSAPANALKAKMVPVFMGLADEEGFPHEGYIDFTNNVVTSSTGTITVRGVFPNPASSTGRRLLRPGLFVRIRLPISKPHPAILVSEQAVGSDQGSKFLYVVNADNTVAYRPVKTGPLQDDGLRVIESGLKADERVVVSGLQLVRPKMHVEVEEQPMVATAVRSDAGEAPQTRKHEPATAPARKSSTEHGSKDAAPRTGSE
jgi:membrane fusion protein, multidrug efflux system